MTGLQALVAEHDRVSHHVLGQDLGAGLDHHDGVSGAGDDEVELGLLHLAGQRVDHELAVDAADADGADGALEGDLADGQRGRRGDGADDVRVVLLVGREHREHALHVVLVALGEERADGTVGQATGEDGRLGRARLTLDEAAGDLARGVHPLLEVDGEREEVETGAGVGPIGRAQQHGVAVLHGHGTTSEVGHLASLDGDGATAEFGRKGGYRHLSSNGDDRRTGARWDVATLTSPEVFRRMRCAGSVRAAPAGAVSP